MASDERLYLTTEEFADRYRVSSQYVRRIINAGVLAPVIKRGRLIRIPVSTIEAWENGAANEKAS